MSEESFLRRALRNPREEFDRHRETIDNTVEGIRSRISALLKKDSDAADIQNDGEDDDSAHDLSLESIDEDIWVCTMPFNAFGLTITSRMTIVRLPGRHLFIHSPLRLLRNMESILNGLGEVRYVVCPNKFHHKFVRDYYVVYRDAKIFSTPGLAEKRSDLRFYNALADKPYDAWKDVLEHILFAGAPALNELVFFHKPSKTLILTDLACNVGPDSAPGLRTWVKLNGQYGVFGPTRAVKMMFKDKARAQRSLLQVVNWDFDKVVLAHGDIVTEQAKVKFMRAFQWLLD